MHDGGIICLEIRTISSLAWNLTSVLSYSYSLRGKFRPATLDSDRTRTSSWPQAYDVTRLDNHYHDIENSNKTASDCVDDVKQAIAEFSLN